MDDQKAPAPAQASRGVIARIFGAFWNTLGGIQAALRSEPTIRLELWVACIALPLSFFIARDLWTWVALVGSLLLLFAIEFLNTAIERLCDYVQPKRHEAIRITKDLASAGVFFALLLCGLVWLAALWARFAA